MTTPDQDKLVAGLHRQIADILDPVPPAPPTPTPPGPTGFTGRTQVDASKWKTLIEEDFTTPAPEGQFLKLYGKNWDAYPTTDHTTSGKGYYDPNRISAIVTPDGVSALQCRLVPGSANPNGKPSGCAPQVKINASAWNGTKGEKGEARLKVAKPSAGFKIAAPMGWPLLNPNWPKFGEGDIGEFPLTPTATVGGHLHVQNGGTHGEGQVELTSSVPVTDWFTLGWERDPGNYFSWFVNGQLVTTVKRTDLKNPYGIPNDFWRWVLQHEDDGNPTTEALVWWDWFVLYSKAS